MKIGKNSYIYGLEVYGLTLDKFAKLKKKEIVANINFRFPKHEKWFGLKPEIRGKKINEFLFASYVKLKKYLPKGSYRILGDKKTIRSVRAKLVSPKIIEIAKKDFIWNIDIESIEGIKPPKPKPKPKLKKKFSYYAVRSIFAIQVESIKDGMQKYEERTILVKALSYEDAERIAKKEYKDYGETYLNLDNLMVRWKFERVIDIYETDIYIDKLDYVDSEVFSVIKKRRMKPEYEWHPLKEKKRN